MKVSKTLILIIPVHFELYRLMVRSCKELGYEVKLIFLTDSAFKYKNRGQRIKSFICKNLLGDKNYKKRLIYDTVNKELQNSLLDIDQSIDFTLVIRPDLLSIDSIKLLKSKVKHIVAYQWDGLMRFPEVFKRIPYFDKFFVFDKSDSLKYKEQFNNLFYISNFYFPYPKQIGVNKSEKELIFIGSYLKNRMPSILNLIRVLQEQNIKSDIYLHCTDKKILDRYKDSGIKFLKKPLTYKQLLETENNYKAILDFDNSTIHQGVSFRVFEALYLKKKLITNNPLIKDYEFYNKANFFIWDDKNINEIVDFINQSYEDITPELVEKYSFEAWLRVVLDHKN